MPKKFPSENTKATAARARKAVAKEVEEAKKKKAVEDALWEDDDKHLARKQQRKDDTIKKKEEQQKRKAEAKALLETEMTSQKLKAALPASKLTRFQLQGEIEKKKDNTVPKVETHLSKPLEENVNRIEVDGEEARSITEAIAILNVNSTAEDKHPERRMKAAFADFEKRNMPRIKEENPTLRLSQLKQMLKREWMKSPDNPFNQIY